MTGPKVKLLEGFDGLVVTLSMSDGTELDHLCSVEFLRDLIRATYGTFGKELPNNSIGHPPKLELVHSGVAQEVGTVDSQLILSTVEVETIVLSADEIGLTNLREQIDRVLALRGGSKTVQ